MPRAFTITIALTALLALPTLALAEPVERGTLASVTDAETDSLLMQLFTPATFAQEPATGLAFVAGETCDAAPDGALCPLAGETVEAAYAETDDGARTVATTLGGRAIALTLREAPDVPAWVRQWSGTLTLDDDAETERAVKVTFGGFEMSAGSFRDQ